MIEVVAAFIVHNGRFFLQQRRFDREVFPGQWEIPGGKREDGEKLRDALARELGEELMGAPGAWLVGSQRFEVLFQCGASVGEPCVGTVRNSHGSRLLDWGRKKARTAGRAARVDLVAQLRRELAEAREAAAMACETPPPNCSCAGCLLAVEVMRAR